MVLLDTCTLLWWTLDPSSLSAAAVEACSAIPAKGGYASSVSLWEIGVKWKKNALDLGGLHLREFERRLGQLSGLHLVPVSGSIWVEGICLEWEHRDPADRVIVATARLLHAPIVTKDGVIRSFCPDAIW